MKRYFHSCHHCCGVGCEVCEEQGGWYEQTEPCVVCGCYGPARDDGGVIVSNMCDRCAALVLHFGSVAGVQDFLRSEARCGL